MYYYRASWMLFGKGCGHHVHVSDVLIDKSEWLKYFIYAGPFDTFELAGKKKALV